MCQKVLHTLRLLQKFNVPASLNECCLLFSAGLSLLTLTEAVSRRLRCVCLFAAWPVVVATLTLYPFLIILVVVVVVVVLPLLEYFSVTVAAAVELVKSN